MLLLKARFQGTMKMRPRIKILQRETCNFDVIDKIRLRVGLVQLVSPTSYHQSRPITWPKPTTNNSPLSHWMLLRFVVIVVVVICCRNLPPGILYLCFRHSNSPAINSCVSLPFWKTSMTMTIAMEIVMAMAMATTMLAN